MSSEKLDIIDWHTEASAVIEDVKDHVMSIQISEKLITGTFIFSLLSRRETWKIYGFLIIILDVGIYINLQTLEEEKLTCFLDNSGFKIVGLNFDSCDNEDDNAVYETIQSLIQTLSPAYTQSFGNALVDKLSKLSWAVTCKYNFLFKNFMLANIVLPIIKIDCVLASTSASSSTTGISCLTYPDLGLILFWPFFRRSQALECTLLLAEWCSAPLSLPNTI